MGKIVTINIIKPVLYKYIGYRVLHKDEGGWPNTPLGMPEVMPPNNAIAVYMTEAIQLMSYNLMFAMNKLITAQLWTRVHDGDRAFTNGHGFDMYTENPDGTKTSDPRANYVLKKDLTAELPAYDKCQRVCGGSFIRGVETLRNGVPVLRCVAGVHGIDADKPILSDPESIQKIIDNSWFIYAVSMDTPTSISHFPQGQGGPVAIPFLIRNAIEFPLQHFEKWEANALPDPLKIYK